MDIRSALIGFVLFVVLLVVVGAVGGVGVIELGLVLVVAAALAVVLHRRRHTDHGT